MGSNSVKPANDNVARPAIVEAQRAPRPCPTCGRPSTPESRPFCSKRCADVDLHRWLGGQYRIEAGPDEPDDLTDTSDA
jgi:uncharacterized protein